MNSTGESDDNNWGDVVNDYRRNHVRGLLMRLIGILLASREGPTKGKVPDEWSIAFPPLEEMDDNERADIRLKTAQADHIYVEDEVLVPEEVATSRFRPEGFSTETQVDLELRESMKEERLKQVEENIKNPPPPPVVTPGVPGALEVVDE
jgi:hypothetical protein